MIPFQKIHTSNAISVRFFDHVPCDPHSTAAALPSLVMNVSTTERCESSLLAGFLYYSKGSEVDRLSLCTLASLMVLIKLS
ncbi:hypothetical protein Y032_0024g964 [Ancylostoma ceylanicum]|uniref:Uncharacterized protein n=1 Tax=Ancylostoma ceylanicum TaxID=53326 RepID=A0A016UXY0_9BILA|nr:hypothetical protein Y032_0024g964 [Ancylostoma ceylanicum]